MLLHMNISVEGTNVNGFELNFSNASGSDKGSLYRALAYKTTYITGEAGTGKTSFLNILYVISSLSTRIGLDVLKEVPLMIRRGRHVDAEVCYNINNIFVRYHVSFDTKIIRHENIEIGGYLISRSDAGQISVYKDKILVVRTAAKDGKHSAIRTLRKTPVDREYRDFTIMVARIIRYFNNTVYITTNDIFCSDGVDEINSTIFSKQDAINETIKKYFNFTPINISKVHLEDGKRKLIFEYDDREYIYFDKISKRIYNTYRLLALFNLHKRNEEKLILVDDIDTIVQEQLNSALNNVRSQLIGTGASKQERVYANTINIVPMEGQLVASADKTEKELPWIDRVKSSKQKHIVFVENENDDAKLIELICNKLGLPVVKRERVPYHRDYSSSLYEGEELVIIVPIKSTNTIFEEIKKIVVNLASSHVYYGVSNSEHQLYFMLDVSNFARSQIQIINEFMNSNKNSYVLLSNPAIDVLDIKSKSRLKEFSGSILKFKNFVRNLRDDDVTLIQQIAKNLEFLILLHAEHGFELSGTEDLSYYHLSNIYDKIENHSIRIQEENRTNLFTPMFSTVYFIVFKLLEVDTFEQFKRIVKSITIVEPPEAFI